MKRCKLGKKCGNCGVLLSDINKSGFCNKHRDRTGANNPFYGKTHSKETVDIIKKKNKIISTNLWKNKEYRDKVIKAVSKPRRESFKREQSERVTQWYKDNPEQREIRRIHMTQSWKDGKITKTNKPHSSKSKKEKKMWKDILEVESTAEVNIAIKTDEGKWYLPDVSISRNNMVVEFYGDYWHANPFLYKAEDIVHHGITAQQIWDHDLKRKNALEEIGYKVIIVWDSSYKTDMDELFNLLEVLEWDACAL